MQETVRKYLNQANPDYEEGIALLMKVSKNRILIQRLSRKPWPEKVLYELEKWLKMSGDVIKPVKKVVVKKPEAAPPDVTHLQFGDPTKIKIIKNKREVLYKDLPKDLQKRWDDNARMYKESRSLHEKVKLLKNADEEILEPIVGRMIDLLSAVRENWNVIDAWNPEKEDIGRPVLDAKRASSNRKAISENLKKLEDDPSNVDVRRKLQARISEMKEAGQGFKADMIERFKVLDLDLG